MDKAKQPGIYFNGIILVGEEFWRNYEVPDDSSVEFVVKLGNESSGTNHSVELHSNLKLVKDGKETLRLTSKFIGFFSIIKGEENMDIKEYVRCNAPALMFPYVREHISSITGKSGINPVYLPPLNIKALLNGKSHQKS